MSDTVAPVLHSLSLDKTTLNVDTGQTTLLVTAHFSDNLSGLFDGIYANGMGGSPPQIRFVSPSGQTVDGIFDILHPVSGDRLDGVFQARLTLPSTAEAGIWKVEGLLLKDEAGNTNFLTPDNSAMLAGTAFSVANGGPQTPLRRKSHIPSLIKPCPKIKPGASRSRRTLSRIWTATR